MKVVIRRKPLQIGILSQRNSSLLKKFPRDALIREGTYFKQLSHNFFWANKKSRLTKHNSQDEQYVLLFCNVICIFTSF